MEQQILLATVFELGKYPSTKNKEIAMCGRSNCGKSSLINAVFNLKIARTSSKPGKTASINFFNYKDLVTLADLPGYGYANVSRAIKKTWQPLVEDYLSSRKQLKEVFILSDVRRGIEQEEIDLIHWLKEQNISVSLVFTKTDKLTNNELAQKYKLWQDKAKRVFYVSATKKTGVEELKNYLEGFATKK